MSKKTRSKKFSQNEIYPNVFPDEYGDSYDDFEDWEGDYYFLNKQDYQGLLKYRKQIAERRPDDFYVRARLGEAYNLIGDYEKALELLSKLHKEAPYHGDVHYYILDALFATERNENDFAWIEKPLIIRLTREVLNSCYNYLKPKRKPRSIDELYTNFVIQGYVCFSEEDLFKALIKDERFIIDNPDQSLHFAEIQVLRKRKR